MAFLTKVYLFSYLKNYTLEASREGKFIMEDYIKKSAGNCCFISKRNIVVLFICNILIIDN